MAMEVNGANVLTAISKDPSSFAMNVGQVNTLAVTILVGRLKDKAASLEHFRFMVVAIGIEDFRLILDHLSIKELAPLSKRIDPKHPDIKSSSEAWYRVHISNLAECNIEPTPAIVKPASKSKTSTSVETGSKTGPVMKSKALKTKTPTGARAGAAKKTKHTPV